MSKLPSSSESHINATFTTSRIPFARISNSKVECSPQLLTLLGPCLTIPLLRNDLLARLDIPLHVPIPNPSASFSAEKHPKAPQCHSLVIKHLVLQPKLRRDLLLQLSSVVEVVIGHVERIDGFAGDLREDLGHIGDTDLLGACFHSLT